MKKIFFYTAVLISIPFLIVLSYNIISKEEQQNEIKLKYISNIIVRVLREDKNIIEKIPLETYIEGVVAGEMPALFEKEALKSQAVASRSYVLYKINTNKDNDYDVTDTTTTQVYLDEEELKNKWEDNYTTYINKIRQCVNETSMEYLEYNGSPINALFFSTSNGYTEDALIVFNEEIPYLKSVESIWDSTTSQAFKYSFEISLQEFYEKLSLPYNSTITITEEIRSSSNRIITLKINGELLTGRTLYTKLKLHSTDFTIEQVGTNIIINTTGYGHGVGMSQYGAQGMAQEGYNYKEILSHYYTNTTLTKLEE